MNSDINEYIARFYELLEDLEDGLGGKRLFKECNGKQTWPERGVYLIFEEGENRFKCMDRARVTRVGTHAIKEGEETTLWGRLRNHRGTYGGGGNHRGSVFRRHVGSAFINQSNGGLDFPTWTLNEISKEERQKEKELERLVSMYIGGASLLWLSIDDAATPRSDRAYVERNCIALLSSVNNIDIPSKTWLGNFCPREAIRTSGLWNVDHIDSSVDPQFLDVFETYVRHTIEE